MKYVSLTFDDGRYDNYKYAFPITQRTQLRCTLFCTTGYIDGTWEKDVSWYSAEKPITVDQMGTLRDSGWEIALHGDKHETQKDDIYRALKKLSLWGFDCDAVGCSIPNSKAEELEIQRIISGEYGKNVNYIRRGRKRDTARLSSRVLYALYSVFSLQYAYGRFNKPSVIDLCHIEKDNIPSVVIRISDDPHMIMNFIKSVSDNSWIVFMLHSILPETNSYYGTDPWCWSEGKFTVLCGMLRTLCDSGAINVVTMQEMLNISVESK